MRAAHFVKQSFQRKHRLAIYLIAGNSGHFVGLGLFHPGSNGSKGIIPAGRVQTAILAPQIGLVQALATQAVNGIAGLIGNPFFIDILIQAR